MQKNRTSSCRSGRACALALGLLWCAIPTASSGNRLGAATARGPEAGNEIKEEAGAAGVRNERPWQPCPYPPSETLAGVEFDWSTRLTQARGSDIWPITWADDDCQYAAFGDGAGFGAADTKSGGTEGRVSMGVARIEGPWDGYRGVNVWGGKNAENPAQLTGKGTGILCVDGALYMMVGGPASSCIPETRVAVSRDHSRTWTLSEWKWTMGDRLFGGAFLNFGRDYAGTRDGHVYVYFTRIANPPPPDQPRKWIHETPGRIDLARVPKDRLLEQAAYEWFAGLDGAGRPQWSADMKARAHVFKDSNGIKVVSVCRQPSPGRYLLAYNPKDNRGNFGLFEAPEPWGPWRNVAYLRQHPPFLPPEENQRVSIFHFAPKWWSTDGQQFTLIFNTGDDAWNTVRGRLHPR